MAIAALVASPWAAASPPASAQPAAVGACLLRLDLTGNVELVPADPPPPPPPLPELSPTELNVNGDGTCVVNGDLDDDVDIDVHGLLATVGDTPTWSCAGGAATGTLTFDVDHDAFPAPVSADVVATAVGAVLTLVAVEDESPFAGAGTFAQDTTSATTCPTDGWTSSTWCGPFAFAVTDVTLS